jgi:small subunit ribosomal protein S17e
MEGFDLGRIKINMVKRVSNELIEKDRQSLSTDFSANKAIVSSKINVPSKKIRNVIAGYVSRLMKRKAE